MRQLPSGAVTMLFTDVEGSTTASVSALTEAARHGRGVGEFACQVLEALAATRLHMSQPARAGTLIGAAQADRGRRGSAEFGFWSEVNRKTAEGVREALGDQAHAAFARGHELDLDEAIDFALQGET